MRDPPGETGLGVVGKRWGRKKEGRCLWVKRVKNTAIKNGKEKNSWAAHCQEEGGCDLFFEKGAVVKMEAKESCISQESLNRRKKKLWGYKKPLRPPRAKKRQNNRKKKVIL